MLAVGKAPCGCETHIVLLCQTVSQNVAVSGITGCGGEGFVGDGGEGFVVGGGGGVGGRGG